MGATFEVRLDLDGARRQLAEFKNEADAEVKAVNAQIRAIHAHLGQSAAQAQIHAGTPSSAPPAAQVAAPVGPPAGAPSAGPSPIARRTSGLSGELRELKGLLKTGLMGPERLTPARKSFISNFVARGTDPTKLESGAGAGIVRRALSMMGAPGRAVSNYLESGLGPTNYSTITAGVGGAAAIYATARTAATATTLGIESLKGAFPDLGQASIIKGLQTQAENFMRAFANFEARIASVIPALSATANIAKAGASLTGELPSVGLYFDAEQNKIKQEKELESTFDRFKGKALAGAIGKSMMDAFKAGFNR